jgi:AraC-like DNA-binding protein
MKGGPTQQGRGPWENPDKSDASAFYSRHPMTSTIDFAPTKDHLAVSVKHGQQQVTWQLGRGTAVPAHPGLAVQAVGPLLMLSMQAPRLTGAFSAQEHVGDDVCGVLFNLKGHQQLRDAQRNCLIEPGDIVVWSSRFSCNFEVMAPQDKLQLLVPRSHLERLMPLLVPERGWTRLPRRGAMPMLARVCMESLWKQRLDLEQDELQAAADATLDLLVRGLRPARHPHRSKADRFTQVLDYVDQALDDPALAPTSIAHRFGCSVRSLHALFAEHGTSVASEIRRRRLERCRDDLAGRGHGDRIGELALRWGFSDAAQFSKLFKSRYGVSPRQYRHGNLRGTSAVCAD